MFTQSTCSTTSAQKPGPHPLLRAIVESPTRMIRIRGGSDCACSRATVSRGMRQGSPSFCMILRYRIAPPDAVEEGFSKKWENLWEAASTEFNTGGTCANGIAARRDLVTVLETSAAACESSISECYCLAKFRWRWRSLGEQACEDKGRESYAELLRVSGQT